MNKNTKHPLWKRWLSFRNWCNNPNNYHYKYYGGRGLGYDPRWDDFETFVFDIESTIGPLPGPGLMLDRIDNDQGYFLGNLRWANSKENYRNKQNNLMVTYQGQTLALAEWCEKLGLNLRTVWSRIKDYNMTPEEALTRPIK